MTVLSQPASDPALTDTKPVSHTRADWLTWAAVTGFLGLFYGLLLNIYWVPGGDSEVYIDIARSLATGKGYLWNGLPVAMVPPGWPWVMAGMMLIWPTFLGLKLLTLLSMLGAMSVGYWICRRFLSPGWSAGTVLLTGTLSYVYTLTFWLHADALFVLLTNLSILLAMQIREERPGLSWRIAALLLLSAMAVCVRWAGLLNWVILAAVLLEGELRPRINHRWIITAVCGLVIVGTFVSLRLALYVSPQELAAFRAAGGAEGADVELILPEQVTAGDETFVASQYRVITATGGGNTGYAMRLASWGSWISFLLWQPLRLGVSVPAVWWASTLLGWTLILVMLAGTVEQVRRRQWLIGAVLLYSLALCLNWSLPNARYLVPIALLIILSVLLGTRALLRWSTEVWQQRWLIGARGVWIGSVAAVSLAMYVVDVRVMRSNDFYGVYEAGAYKPIIAIAQYLARSGVGDGQVAMSTLYVNMGRMRYSPTNLRAVSMLTDLRIVSWPRTYARRDLGTRDQEFRRWCGREGIIITIEPMPVSPWRVWHFRTPRLQERMTGQPATPISPEWRLWHHVGAGYPTRLPLPTEFEPPTRVPGL